MDRDRRFGAAAGVSLEVEDVNTPRGELVVTLRWDTDADLDLHVVDPRGVEIWARNPSSWELPRPGSPPDPNGWKTGGFLDFDSNAQCVIDGRRQESGVWSAAPPPGRYIVRVDTFSLCRATSVHWSVEVFHAGDSIGVARGTSTATSTRPPHDAGSGVAALEFEIP